MLTRSESVYGREARDRLIESRDPGMEGARAALETFYRAFNTRDLDLLTSVWLDDPLVQLNNPVGGLLRGRDAIADLYARVFHSEARVWVQLEDIVEVATETCAIFAGRERGEFTAAQETLTLQIRTSRCFVYAEQGGGWRQVHHHGSIDDPALLARYQAAVSSSPG